MEIKNGVVQSGESGQLKNQMVGIGTITDRSEMDLAGVRPGMTSDEAEQKVRDYRNRPTHQPAPGGGWALFVMVFFLLLPAYFSYKAFNDRDEFGPMFYVYLWTPLALVFLFQNARRLFRAFRSKPQRGR